MPVRLFHLVVPAILVGALSCSPLSVVEPRPETADASVLDAGSPGDLGRADSGVQGGGPLDGSVSVAEDGGSVSGAGRGLVVAQATGQVISWSLDSSMFVVSKSHVLDLGERIMAVARKPKTALYVVASQGASGPARFHLLARGQTGALSVIKTFSAEAQDIGSMSFDSTGTWLTFSASDGFRMAKVEADNTTAPSVVVGRCDAQSLIEVPGGYLGSCGNENRLLRFDFSAASGLTNARTQVSFPAPFNPGPVVAWDDNCVVHGRKQNGVSGSENRAALVIGTANTPASTVTMKPPNTDMSRVYGTVAAKHPSMQVGYFVNGGSHAYGGNNLAVVGMAGSATLEVRQYVMLPWDNSYNSGAVTVSKDGRWLLVASNIVSEVRGWPIDSVTGKLGAGQVVALADSVVFLELEPIDP
jgi:hypothetical protein